MVPRKLIFMRKILCVLLIFCMIMPTLIIKSQADIKPNAEYNYLAGNHFAGDTFTVNFATIISGQFYGLEAYFNYEDTGTATNHYISPVSLTPGGSCSPTENDIITDPTDPNYGKGHVVWVDNTFTGFPSGANGEIWSCTYHIDDNIPVGDYTISLDIVSLTGGRTGFDPVENLHLSSTIHVSKAQTSIVPEITNYQSSYEYQGFPIEPAVIVKPTGSNTVLTAGVDYSISYGTNTDLGTGSITISPISTSDYTFTETTVNFDITQQTILSNRVVFPENVTYTGQLLSPDVTVYNNNGYSLTKNVDYTVSYTNQDGEIGEQLGITITGINNYTGTVSTNIDIIAKPSRPNIDTFPDETLTYGDLSNHMTEADVEVIFSSSDDCIEVTHTYDGISYNNLKAMHAGNALITVKYAEDDNYAETTTSFNVTVIAANLIVDNIDINNKVYDKTTQATIKNNSITINGLVNGDNYELGTDFVVVSSKFADANVGENKLVTVELATTGTYDGKYILNARYQGRANITKCPLAESDVSLDEDVFVYSGGAKEPVVTVTKFGDTLTLADYTVTYSNNVNRGTATVTVNGINNFSGTITKSFIINPKSIEPYIIDIPDYEYSGSEITPDIQVFSNRVVLYDGTDYTKSYSNNINVGKATVTVSEVNNGNYTFTNVETNFNITKYTLKASDVTIEYNTVRHDGNAKEPAVTVTANGNQLVLDQDFSVSYENNTDVGTANVIVTGAGNNYQGSITKTFNIVDKEELVISGIEDNQQITYNENPVELVGTLTVSDNTDNITADSITTKWYDADDNEIDRPTNVGLYSVLYSIESENYIGSKLIHFEIVKATSPYPTEIENTFNGVEGSALSNITFKTVGIEWVAPTTILTKGSNKYPAKYTKNGDTTNYTTIDVEVTVYGCALVNMTTSVEGEGGTISESIDGLLEGTTQTIVLTPEEGYEVDKLLVNGEEVNVVDNKYDLTIGDSDIVVKATFKKIIYTITIDLENVVSDPEGIILVEYNNDQDITIKAKFGYVLRSVKVNDVEMIEDLVDDVLTLKNVLSDKTIVAKAERIVYKVIEGANQIYQKGSDTNATFKIDKDLSAFKNVYIDDLLVDTSRYTKESGSTVIKLKKEYMDSLAAGNHTIVFNFEDGGIATTAFEVKDKVTNNSGNSVFTTPKTGDIVVVYSIFAVISLAGIIILSVLIKKMNKRYKVD